jgi:ABC-type taurine transport system substrate-binding protein
MTHEFGKTNPDFITRFLKAIEAANAAYRFNPAAWTADSAQVKAIPLAHPGIFLGWAYCFEWRCYGELAHRPFDRGVSAGAQHASCQSALESFVRLNQKATVVQDEAISCWTAGA